MKSRKPKLDFEMKKLCSGCYNDRYNYPGTCERPGIDAVVTSEKCWDLSVEKLVYYKPTKCWRMLCHSKNGCDAKLSRGADLAIEERKCQRKLLEIDREKKRLGIK